MSTTLGTRASGLARRVPAHLDIVLSDDIRYDDARRAFNLAVDQRPAAVAHPSDAAEVADVLRWARSNDLRVAAQSTGHGAHPLGALDGIVLLRTAKLDEIIIDAEARTARVGAGARWGAVVDAAARVGLAALAGSSPTVGVAGYTLGGGLGWLGRKYGLACNSVTAVEMVSADGELLRVDASHHPDLFWAVRGGGGSYGIVTALELTLYDVPDVFAGTIIWDGARMADVMHAYRAWVETLGREMTSLVRVLNLPPLPMVPELLRNRTVVAIEACWLGDAAEGERVLAPLRAIDGRIMDTFATMPVASLQHLHNDPPEPVPASGDHLMLRDLAPGAIDAIVAACGPTSGSPLVSLELRHLGGALAEVRAGHGALSRIDAAFAMYGVGIAPSPDARSRIDAHFDRLLPSLAPWSTGGAYLNFAEREPSARKAFSGETYVRLAAVKRAWDPANVIAANHQVVVEE